MDGEALFDGFAGTGSAACGGGRKRALGCGVLEVSASSVVSGFSGRCPPIRPSSVGFLADG